MKKKDPDYIAAIERAVTDKYGKQAVQDFRSRWEPEKEKEYLKRLLSAVTFLLKKENRRCSPKESALFAKHIHFRQGMTYI